MHVSKTIHQRIATPAGLGLVAAVGQVAALAATYWDDSWHTDKGRDEFWIPPHLLLYTGVLMASLAVAVWGVLAWKSVGWGIGGIRRVLTDPALSLAGIGGVTTLASAPIDDAWHRLFGRDAVLWSPPHLLAVAGVLALAVGLLAGLRTTVGRGAGTARLLAAAGVIGALQVPVLEYDSDVPQFPTTWYLPVAALGLCVAAALLDDLLPGRWHPAQAALAYTLLRAAVVGLLSGLGFSLTAIPPVFAMFLIMGALASRPLAVRLVVLGALAPLVWWPVLLLQADVATIVPAAELPAAVALGAAAGLLVALIHGDLKPARTARWVSPAAVVLGIVTLAVVVVVVGRPAPAWAHDPGQGEQVREGLLSVQRADGRAELTMTLPGPCGELVAIRTVARRAGDEITGPLSVSDGKGRTCRLSGTVAGLSPGQWFVYAELDGVRGQRLEAWLPVTEGAAESGIRPLYEPPARASSGSRDAVGAVLLLAVAGLIVACVRLARRSGPGRLA